jgi:hypothetical protein
MAPETVAERFELWPHFGGAVDLAVIGDDVATGGRDHRLRAGRRQINDRESRMPEAKPRVGIDEHAARVRSPMGEPCRHGDRNRLELLRPGPALKLEKACDAAHEA